ncbi:MAG: hypothetical protein RBR71_05745 [Gudongella sp.]|nr:hypothetical protein [Gudongella sp.]
MIIENLEISKQELLDRILNRIKAWDMDIETGIKIIEENGNDIKRIQEYNRDGAKKSVILETEEDYIQRIEELSTEMKCFLDKMDERKRILLEEKKILGKSNEIIKNYISSDFKAVFIDKNA